MSATGRLPPGRFSAHSFARQRRDVVEIGYPDGLACSGDREQHRPMTLDSRMLAIAAAGLFALFTSSTGSACSFAQRKLTSSQVRQQARDDFKRASAVIDAVVIEPMNFGKEWKPGLTPIAYLKASKIWKGHVEQESVPVVYITSCDIGLETQGEKVRILLTGNGVFKADQGMNGGGILDLTTYQAEIDRLAGRRRPPALMHFPGAIPPPIRKRNVR